MNFADYKRPWFDALALYGQRFHLGEAMTYPVVEMGSIIKLTPNRRNLQKLRNEITIHMPENGPDYDLRAALVEHIDAILGRYFQVEFKYHFSEKKGVVSATSEFFSLVRQALDYHRDDAAAELKYIMESGANLKYSDLYRAELEDAQQRHFDVDEIRACPQDDGTITYLGCSQAMGEDRLLRPVVAFALMRAGVPVTLALNDIRDEHSHWESQPVQVFRV